MKKQIYYANLTNGLEAAIMYPQIEWRFIRLQSTACEQKRWNFILQQISDDFYFNLALGKECLVWDYSNKRISPRAIWQGIEFIKYTLLRYWLKKSHSEIKMDTAMKPYFQEQYKKINNQTWQKLRYFKQFLNTDELNIKTVTSQTNKDGNYKWFIKNIQEQ